MNQFRFILQPYKNPGSRYRCPECHRPHSFVRYIDTEDKIVFPDYVGRCNREQKCGYHYTPKQYFADHPEASEKNSDISQFLPRQGGGRIMSTTIAERQPPKPPSTINRDLMRQTMKGYDSNNFFLFIAAIVGRDEAMRLMSLFNIGTSIHWPGSCVFWQSDVNGNLRTGKIMLYDWKTGHRVKQPFNHVSWVHSVMKLPDFNLRQCLFGEHQLAARPDDVVAIVESEKSAVIATHFMPQFVWLATGGKNGAFNRDALSVLSGREVLLVPDLGATEDWYTRIPMMKSLGISVSIFDFLEQNATVEQRKSGLDIADYLVSELTPQGILEGMMQRNPALRDLVDKLDLEIVSVERMTDEEIEMVENSNGKSGAAVSR